MKSKKSKKDYWEEDKMRQGKVRVSYFSRGSLVNQVTLTSSDSKSAMQTLLKKVLSKLKIYSMKKVM